MVIIDKLKNVARLAQEVGKMDLYQQAVELQVQVRAQQKLTDAERLVADLREALRIRGILTFRAGVYFSRAGDGPEDGPFCSRCWDADQVLIHVDRPDRHYYCRNCKTGTIPKEPLPPSLGRKPLGW
jgi:hypothetical protein